MHTEEGIQGSKKQTCSEYAYNSYSRNGFHRAGPCQHLGPVLQAKVALAVNRRCSFWGYNPEPEAILESDTSNIVLNVIHCKTGAACRLCITCCKLHALKGFSEATP